MKRNNLFYLFTKKANLLKILAASILIGFAATAINANSKTHEIEPIKDNATKSFLASSAKNIIDAKFQNSQFIAPDMSIYSDLKQTDVMSYFESRGCPWDIVVKDGAYPSAGPLQFNASPGYMLDSFLKTVEVREKFGNFIDSFGGIHAIRQWNKSAIIGIKTLLKNSEFQNLYLNYADVEYSWWFEEFQTRFGIDLSKRSEAVKGFVKTIINNRRNDVFNVAKDMLKICSIEQLNSIDDKQFTQIMNKSVAKTLSQNLAHSKLKNSIIKNYNATLHYITPSLDKIYKTKSEQVDIIADAAVKYLSAGLSNNALYVANYVVKKYKNMISSDVDVFIKVAKNEFSEMFSKQLSGNTLAFIDVKDTITQIAKFVTDVSIAANARNKPVEQIPIQPVISGQQKGQGLLALAMKKRKELGLE